MAETTIDPICDFCGFGMSYCQCGKENNIPKPFSDEELKEQRLIHGNHSIWVNERRYDFDCNGCRFLATISALQKRVGALEKNKRATICLWCGGIIYIDPKNINSAYELMREHDLALDFYSNPKNYEKQGYEGTINSKVIADNGHIARAARENKR
jgi:hypothetical protein